MEFSKGNLSGFPVFKLKGKIMGEPKCELFCNELLELIDSDQKQIVLDFSQVRWINSTGIGMMLSCMKRSREKGGELYFTGIKGRVAYYFRITKLETELDLFETLDQAIQVLNASRILEGKK